MFENTNSSFENTNSSFQNTNSSFQNTNLSFQNTNSNCARKYFVRRYNFTHRLYINSFDAKIKLIKSSLQPDPCVRIFAREIFVQAYKGLID